MPRVIALVVVAAVAFFLYAKFGGGSNPFESLGGGTKYIHGWRP